MLRDVEWRALRYACTNVLSYCDCNPGNCRGGQRGSPASCCEHIRSKRSASIPPNQEMCVGAHATRLLALTWWRPRERRRDYSSRVCKIAADKPPVGNAATRRLLPQGPFPRGPSGRRRGPCVTPPSVAGAIAAATRIAIDRRRLLCSRLPRVPIRFCGPRGTRRTEGLRSPELRLCCGVTTVDLVMPNCSII
jgi:hypothetical protein